MKVVDNYKDIVTQSDRYKSNDSKNDLIYLIRKFLLNENGEKPKTKILRTINKYALKIIWLKNRPNDLYSQFHNY